MTTSLQLYQAVLYHLNRYSAPDFDVADFRFFINEAVNELIKDELKEFELTQVISDRLRVWVKSDSLTFNADGSTNNKQEDLPGDYRHLLRCIVKLFYKEATLAFNAEALRSYPAKRFTGDNYALIYDNYYLKPVVTDSDCVLYARTVNDKLEILFDSPIEVNDKVNIRSADIEYIRKPAEITLTDDYDPSDLEFPEDVARDVAKRCADNFMKFKKIPQ